MSLRQLLGLSLEALRGKLEHATDACRFGCWSLHDKASDRVRALLQELQRMRRYAKLKQLYKDRDHFSNEIDMAQANLAYTDRAIAIAESDLRQFLTQRKG